MKVVIYTLCLVTGILCGLLGLYGYVAILGARGIVDLMLCMIFAGTFLSCSVGGFGSLMFANWARKLLLICSTFIFILLCGATVWNIFNNNAGNWDKIGYTMSYFGCIVLICNLFVFTRPKVKEQFK